MHSLNASSPSICVARDKDSNKEETWNNVQSFYPLNGTSFFFECHELSLTRDDEIDHYQ